MKKLLTLLVLFSFTGLSYLNLALLESDSLKNSEYTDEHNSDLYTDGILRNELSKVSSIANYDIKVELFPDRKELIAEEILVWINKTPFPASEIQIHLYPNAFKNSKTFFSAGRGIKINEETKSSIDFKEIRIGGKTVNLIYLYSESDNKYDSTVAKIILNKPAIPGDTIKVNFKYSVKIPKADIRFGYAKDRNFFFISQWFPKSGVFQNGRWICSQYYPFTNFYSDFGHYNITITVPGKYQVAATGVMKGVVLKKDGKVTYNFVQEGVHDFAWAACDEAIFYNSVYKRNDSTEVTIYALIQPEDIKYSDRYINTVKRGLKYIENNIGVYPYQTLTIVDAPATSQSGGMEYPTLITTDAELFSPEETLQPESVTMHEFIHQFFYGIVANNEVYEAWLDEGVTSYLSDKIVEYYYGKSLLNFKFLGYYPVFGLNLLSYNEIPLIYSIGSYFVPRGADELRRYYLAPYAASILDTSWKMSNSLSYTIEAYSKPELVLNSLERFLGSNKMIEILKEYYNHYKFRHPTSLEFLSVLKEKTGGDFGWIYENLFRSSSTFDYKVNNVKRTDNENEYEVMVERIGDGIFKQDIALYTDNDTLFQIWDGNERLKKIIFRTENVVKGAEIDPYKKNILDLNYANNSYILKRQYGGSLRLSFRFLFWFQNLLLILGSIS